MSKWGPFLNIPKFKGAAVVRQRSSHTLPQYTFANYGGGLGVSTGGVPILKAETHSETLTTASTVVSVATDVSLLNSAGGAIAATLAVGVEGQIKRLVKTSGSNAAIITPVALEGGTTVGLINDGDTATLLYSNSVWNLIEATGRAGIGVTALTASQSPAAAATGAISLTTGISIMTTGANAADDAWTLAAGFEGQIKRIRLGTDGGDNLVVTPVALLDGTTLTFANAGEEVVLLYTRAAWRVIGVGAIGPTIA